MAFLALTNRGLQNRKGISQAELDAYVALLNWLLVEGKEYDPEESVPQVPAIAAGPELKAAEVSRKLDEVLRCPLAFVGSRGPKKAHFSLRFPLRPCPSSRPF